jgi:DNA recombination-dependent growth factor C
MGFFSASCSIYRFTLVEEVPRAVMSNLPELLWDNRFREIEETAEERGFGWVSFEDMLDTDFTTGSPFKGRFAAFALRLDTRRISPAVFKKHYRVALRQLEEQVKQNGGRFVSREQKKELSEQVRLRLLTRMLPVPAVFDVAWDMKSGRVYLAAGQNKVRELFVELFFNTFGLRLEALSPYRTALELLPADERHHLETYEPVLFV